MPLSTHDVVACLNALQQVYSDHKQELTDLDSPIGDADHGINMERGFAAVRAELEKTPPADSASALKAAAAVLIRTVGGASGPLYGTFFLRAAAACTGKASLETGDVLALFQAGADGVQQRGKAMPGDKTMMDALLPAVAAMEQALAGGAGLHEMLQQATAAAAAGMKATIPLEAKKGRASYLGPRSIGHQDPGATSSYLLIKTAAEVWG